MNTRGERNNNPGNLRKGDQPWRGLADLQSDTDFCVFTDPKYGFRAMAKTLLSYGHEGFDTVRDIVHRWAPPNARKHRNGPRGFATRCHGRLKPARRPGALRLRGGGWA